MTKYFVWIKGLRGPVPQIWTGDQTSDQMPIATLFSRKLEPYEENLELDMLIKFYPFEAKE